MPDVHVLPGIWTPIRGYDVLVDALEGLGYKRDNGAKPPNAHRLRLRLAPVQPLQRRAAEDGRRAGARAAAGAGRRVGRCARSSSSCHSMGGLVARWYIEKCGGAEVTRKLITLGTPWRGATGALEQLVNGVKKGIGPISIDLTDFSRSMPSLFQLLPEFACISSPGGYAKTTGGVGAEPQHRDGRRRDGLPDRPAGRGGRSAGQPRRRRT